MQALAYPITWCYNIIIKTINIPTDPTKFVLGEEHKYLTNF